MNRLFLISLAFSLLLVSCEEEGKPSYTPRPAVSMNIISTGFHEAQVEIKSINADRTMYLLRTKGEEKGIQVEDVIGSGQEVPSERFLISDLDDNSEYHIFAAAADASGQISPMVKDTINTPNDPTDGYAR